MEQSQSKYGFAYMSCHVDAPLFIPFLYTVDSYK